MYAFISLYLLFFVLFLHTVIPVVYKLHLIGLNSVKEIEYVTMH